MTSNAQPTARERKRLDRTARFLERRGAYLAAAVTRLGTPRFTDETGSAAIRPKGGDVELIFNRTFFDELKDAELGAVLLHEALHFVFRHIPRTLQIRRQADRFLFRYACEAVINDSITASYPGLPLPGAPVTGELLVGRNVAGLSADEVMALLRDRLEKEPAISIVVAALVTTDDHDAWEGDGSDDGWGSETDGLLAGILEQFGDMDVPAIGQRARGAGREVGKVRIRKDLRRFLEEQVRPRVRYEANWNRPNRKAAALFPEVILPTWEADPAPQEILMAIDTSGSISKAFLDIFAAVASQDIPGNRVTFISFDTRPYLFRKGTAKLRGGGGTRVQAVEEYIRDHMARYPDLVFVFTDGHTPAPTPAHPRRWVWILTPRGTTRAIPAGSRSERFDK